MTTNRMLLRRDRREKALSFFKALTLNQKFRKYQFGIHGCPQYFAGGTSFEFLIKKLPFHSMESIRKLKTSPFRINNCYMK